MAQAAQRQPGLTARVQALSALREAQGHALVQDASTTRRKLDEAYELIEHGLSDISDPRFAHLGDYCTHSYVKSYEAQCWTRLGQPAKAIPVFRHMLLSRPVTFRRDHARLRAHLALAHAANHEPEQAAAEGLAALKIATDITSTQTLRELGHLDRQLVPWADVSAVTELHEALALNAR